MINMNDMYQDDLIDETGFELGMPTHTEMLRHYNSLLEAELTTCQHQLLKAHKDIAGMIVMYRKSVADVATLKAENQRLSRCLSERYESDRASKPTLGYAYGNYTQKADTVKPRLKGN